MNAEGGSDCIDSSDGVMQSVVYGVCVCLVGVSLISTRPRRAEQRLCSSSALISCLKSEEMLR